MGPINNGEVIAKDFIMTYDGQPIKIDTTDFNENIEVDEPFYSGIDMGSLEGSFSAALTNFDIRAFRRLLKPKIPRKLKKKIHGTRRAKKRFVQRLENNRPIQVKHLKATGLYCIQNIFENCSVSHETVK